MSQPKHPFFWARLRTAVGYLVSVQRKQNGSSSSSLSLHFKLFKFLCYSLTVQALLRVLYLSTFDELVNNEESNQMLTPDYLLISPLTVSLIQVYPFIRPTTLRCTCLMGFWALYLDYALTFKLDGPLLELLYQMIIENGLHFRRLNDRRLGWSDLMIRFDGKGKAIKGEQMKKQWWRLPHAYLTLAKKIWKVSSQTGYLKFHSPNLSFVSSQFRARMIVYVAVVEAVISFLLAFIGMEHKIV